MKRKLLRFELWFNKNLGWILTNPRKIYLLEARIAQQEKILRELKS